MFRNRSKFRATQSIVLLITAWYGVCRIKKAVQKYTRTKAEFGDDSYFYIVTWLYWVETGNRAFWLLEEEACQIGLMVNKEKAKIVVTARRGYERNTATVRNGEHLQVRKIHHRPRQ